MTDEYGVGDLMATFDKIVILGEAATPAQHTALIKAGIGALIATINDQPCQEYAEVTTIRCVPLYMALVRGMDDCTERETSDIRFAFRYISRDVLGAEQLDEIPA